MATKYAHSNGNFSAGGSGGIWYDAASGGSETTKPTGTDIAEANNYTVVIDEDVSCAELTNANGGGFTVDTASAARTITAELTASGTALLTASLSSSNLLTVDGDITGGSASAADGIIIAVRGLLQVGTSSNTRTITGGTHADARGVEFGTLTCYTATWYANLVAATANAALIRTYDSDTTLTITGTLTASTVPALCIPSGTGRVILKGSIAGTATSFPFFVFITTSSAASRVFWDAADGSTLTWYDSSGNAHVLKVPDYPAEEDVESGVDYDYEAKTGTLSASCDYPAEADVQSGVSFGSGVYTGTFTAPAVGDVQAGVTYGGGGTEYEGTFAVPSVGDVATGVGYGAGGTEFEGTLEISGLSESQMEAILDARGLTEPASDTADSVARRGASAVTLSDVGSGGGAMHSTTIATLASQTSFTLTAGSADDDAYNYCVVVVTDESTATQKCVGVISDYTGATKTVTLGADPAIFTMAVGDTVEIYPPAGLRWINGAVAAGAETVEATLAAGAITSDAFAAGAIDADAIADGAIDAATFAADVDDEVRAWIVDNSTGDGVRIDSAALNTCTGATIPAIKDTVDSLSSGVTVSDKTGFKLASDGLDAIATTAPSGPATTFREMVVQTWRWFFKRATKTSGSLVTYADDGTTPITTQAITASGTDEERGAAT